MASPSARVIGPRRPCSGFRKLQDRQHSAVRMAAINSRSAIPIFRCWHGTLNAECLPPLPSGGSRGNSGRDLLRQRGETQVGKTPHLQTRLSTRPMPAFTAKFLPWSSCQSFGGSLRHDIRRHCVSILLITMTPPARPPSRCLCSSCAWLARRSGPPVIFRCGEGGLAAWRAPDLSPAGRPIPDQ